MDGRWIGSMRARALAAVLIALTSGPAAAQLLSDRKDDVPPPPPRPATKRPPMTALPARVIEPARTAEGWPDLQGIWSSVQYAGGAQHSLEVGRDPGAILVQGRSPKDDIGNVLIDPMRGMIPYLPAAQATRMELLAGMYAPLKRIDVGPNVMCYQLGVVGMAIPESPWEFRYLPGHIVIPRNTRWRTPRIIPMDGSPHLSEDLKLFNGDSRGRWEGSTLVVETRNNREGTWFDAHGTFHSDAMRVIERWTLVTADQLYYEATIIDPAVFSRPWKWAMNYDRVKRGPENATIEDTCHEAERSIDRMVVSGRRANQAGIRGYYIHMDVETGKAVRPEEQKYLDESGQPPGYVFAPTVSDEDLVSRRWDPATRKWVTK